MNALTSICWVEGTYIHTYTYIYIDGLKQSLYLIFDVIYWSRSLKGITCEVIQVYRYMYTPIYVDGWEELLLIYLIFDAIYRSRVMFGITYSMCSCHRFKLAIIYLFIYPLILFMLFEIVNWFELPRIQTVCMCMCVSYEVTMYTVVFLIGFQTKHHGKEKGSEEDAKGTKESGVYLWGK